MRVLRQNFRDKNWMTHLRKPGHNYLSQICFTPEVDRFGWTVVEDERPEGYHICILYIKLQISGVILGPGRGRIVT